MGVWRAVGLFAVTNVDDIVLLAVFFGRVAGRAGALRVVAGQYLGFTGILALCVAAALGLGLLPDPVLRWLGLVPIALGLYAGWEAWRGESEVDDPAAVGILPVAAVMFAAGGDNVGVYVPVFTRAGAGGITGHVVVFLVLVAVWCAAGFLLATRPLVARTLARWGDVLLPVVLVAIGIAILVG